MYHKPSIRSLCSLVISAGLLVTTLVSFSGINALAESSRLDKLGGGTNNPSSRILNDFGTQNGWTTQYQYPRGLADLNGDGFDDIYGFGIQGVWVSTSNPFTSSDTTANNTLINKYGGGDIRPTVSPSKNIYAGFDTLGGYYNQDFTPRYISDVDGDGLNDIVGIGQSTVKYAVNGYGLDSIPLDFGDFNREAFFAKNTPAQPSKFAGGDSNTVYSDFNIGIGWTDMVKYPRFVQDINNDGFKDILGIGKDGVWASYGRTGGGMTASVKILSDFGEQQGWTNSLLYPRTLADMNGDNYLDIVGFGIQGVWVSLNNGDGSFLPSSKKLNDFDVVTGWTNSNQYPRYSVDVNRDGFADIVGFGIDGVWVAQNNREGGFLQNRLVLSDFGTQIGWTNSNQYPRFIGNMDGDNYLDIVGFGIDGVWINEDFFITYDLLPPLVG